MQAKCIKWRQKTTIRALYNIIIYTLLAWCTTRLDPHQKTWPPNQRVRVWRCSFSTSPPTRSTSTKRRPSRPRSHFQEVVEPGRSGPDGADDIVLWTLWELGENKSCSPLVIEQGIFGCVFKTETVFWCQSIFGHRSRSQNLSNSRLKPNNEHSPGVTCPPANVLWDQLCPSQVFEKKTLNYLYII